MKALLTVATLFMILLASSNAVSQDENSDIGNILQSLGISSKGVLAQNLADDSDDDDEAVAMIMTNALLSTIMEEGEDGEGSIMANIMSSNEEEAFAQLRFLRRLTRRIRRSRTLRRFAGQALRNRLCTGK